MLAVSDRALIIFAATDESLAHDGMSPQRTSRHFADRFLRILANNRDILGRGDVVSGTPVMLHRDGVEIRFDDLFPPAIDDSVRT